LSRVARRATAGSGPRARRGRQRERSRERTTPVSIDTTTQPDWRSNGGDRVPRRRRRDVLLHVRLIVESTHIRITRSPVMTASPKLQRLSDVAREPTFRTIDGVSIRFAESEARETNALLLSPWPESVFAYESLWSRLAEATHLVAIDL